MDIVHIEWLPHYRWCLFSVLELDAIYNWQVTAPNTHCSVPPTSHLCVLTGITWKLKDIYRCCAYWTTALLQKILFVWFRVPWEIWLESYSPRYISVIPWYNTVWVYTLSPIHTWLHVFGAQLPMITKIMYLITTYYTPYGGFIANNISLYMSKVRQLYYTLQSLQLIMHAKY